MFGRKKIQELEMELHTERYRNRVLESRTESLAEEAARCRRADARVRGANLVKETVLLCLQLEAEFDWSPCRDLQALKKEYFAALLQKEPVRNTAKVGKGG